MSVISESNHLLPDLSNRRRIGTTTGSMSGITGRRACRLYFLALKADFKLSAFGENGLKINGCASLGVDASYLSATALRSLLQPFMSVVPCVYLPALTIRLGSPHSARPPETATQVRPDGQGIVPSFHMALPILTVPWSDLTAKVTFRFPFLQ